MFDILLVRLVKPGLQKEMNLLPRQIQAKKPGGNPLLQTKECLECSSNFTTVDGRNPATVDMIIKYPIIYRVLYISGGAGFLSSVWIFVDPSWVLVEK